MPQPAWASVEDQLAQSHVVPGSALEKLIRDNQDFHLLRPKEANDKLGLPPWLRVYWRKQHPKLVYSAKDPTGGYPRVLKNIYAWMLTHQDLRSGSPPAPSEPPEPEAPMDIAGMVSVGFNQRISGAQTTARSESDIRVNYNDVNKIIAASNDIEGGGRQAQFYSSNAGTTWGQTNLPLVLNDSSHSDPAVDWTSDGTAWAITIGIDNQLNLRLRAYKSIDGGATWTFDTTFSVDQTAADKPMMWVDHSPTSPFKDNIYVIWHMDRPAFVNRRTGPAGAWQTPVQVSGAETQRSAIGGDIKTNSFGDVFAFWPDAGSRRLLVAKSTDGGATFAVPVTITATFASYEIGVPSFFWRRALIYVSGGAYRTATKNLVYATWVDLTGAFRCTRRADEPDTDVTSTCKTRIWFARSTDGGFNWDYRMINNQASLNDQFNLRLAVDETDGKLTIIYYDTVGDPGRLKTDVWSQSSYDDGATWTIPAKVTTAQTDETVNGADLGNQYGDYNGLTGYAGTFFLSWTDRRSSGREEIWTAPITTTIVVNLDVVAGATSQGDNVFVFAKGLDGRIYGSSGQFGEHFGDWSAMPGNVLTDAALAATSQGNNVFVFAKGLDGRIYGSSGQFGEHFGDWSAMPGNVLTDAAPAATSQGNNVFVFAKGLDGRIYGSSGQFGEHFGDWSAMPGNVLTDAAPAATSQGNNVFVFAKGLDGRIYGSSGQFGEHFGDWSAMPGNVLTDAALAATSQGDNVFVFAKGLDGRIYGSSGQFGEHFNDWSAMPGNVLTDAAPAATSQGNNVFVFAKGLDGRIYGSSGQFGEHFNDWSAMPGVP